MGFWDSFKKITGKVAETALEVTTFTQELGLLEDEIHYLGRTKEVTPEIITSLLIRVDSLRQKAAAIRT